METLEIVLFIICISVIILLYMCIVNTFNRIKFLKIRISSLKLRIDSLDKELWKIQHPAKYKPGDRIITVDKEKGQIREAYAYFSSDSSEYKEWRYKIDIGILNPIKDLPEWSISLIK